MMGVYEQSVKAIINQNRPYSSEKYFSRGVHGHINKFIEFRNSGNSCLFCKEEIDNFLYLQLVGKLNGKSNSTMSHEFTLNDVPGECLNKGKIFLLIISSSKPMVPRNIGHLWFHIF